MLKWHGPGARKRSRPSTFRGCDLTAECLFARENVRVRFPAAAPNSLRTGAGPVFLCPQSLCRLGSSILTAFTKESRAGDQLFKAPQSRGFYSLVPLFRSQVARQLAPPGLQNPVRLGQHQGGLPFSGVVADKQCTCFASRPMWERYPPIPPFHCGENEIQASPISSASVGATPTPATISGSDLAADL